MQHRVSFTLFCLFLSSLVSAQMWNGTDTLYGNEWIDYGKTYYKIKVADDGLYRINTATLTQAGLANVPFSNWRLYCRGQQVAMYTTTEAVPGSNDYVEFYARKNRGEIDDYLFDNPATQNINPWYSMFNDTMSYFLVNETTSTPLRVSTENNDLTNLPPAEPYIWRTLEQLNTPYLIKKSISDEITYSWFDGAGFAGYWLVEGQANFNLPNIAPNAPNATVTAQYAANEELHKHRIWVNDTFLLLPEFNGWRALAGSISIRPGKLKPATVIYLSTLTGGGSNDRLALAGVRLRYASLPNLNNETASIFEITANNNPQYLELQAFNAGGQTPVLYDLNDGKRWTPAVESGLVKVKLSPATNDRKLLLATENSIKTVTGLTPVQFENYLNQKADYLIVSHPTLRQGNTDQVAAYADYRRSAAGGSHTVTIADIRQLYDQYAYGIGFHPIALRNFFHIAKKNWPELEHALIIGKGLEYNIFRSSEDQSRFVDSLFFVPTGGFPGADLPLVMGNSLREPIVALGRIAAVKPSEIEAYLNKVKEYEQQLVEADQNVASKAWMKRVLHNSGGLAGESASIRYYTSDMANTMTNNRFGADVSTFYKTSNDPIQLTAYEQILDLVNSGVNIWTIFGHSSAFAVDFDIGEPLNYNNKGKYPFMLIMGCFTGICSASQSSLGEQFLLTPDRGAIAYVASVNFSFIDALHTYGKAYYERLGGADYGKSIGQAMKHTIADLSNTNSSTVTAVLHQNLLQGDPAIRVYAHNGPDYLIDQQKVSFTPNPTSLDESNFQVKFDVANIGENTGGQLALNIEQKRPDGVVISRIRDTIPAPPNHTSLQYNLPVNGSQIGFNRFFINLDPANQIAEQPTAAELNNALTDASGQAGQDVYFFADDVQPVYPPAYGIVGKPEVTLRASTLNINLGERRYLFEMDTLETFDSPFKLSGALLQRGGLLEWNVPKALQNNTVYYWRVARDSIVNGQVVWRNRSFLFLENAESGWNQSHYGQYRDGFFGNLIASDSLRNIQFTDNAANMDLTVAYRDVERYPGMQNNFYDAFKGDYGFSVRGVDDGVVMAMSDPITGHFIPNTLQDFNQYDPPGKGTIFWWSTRDPQKRKELMDFLENQVPNGAYVGFLAFGRPWDTISYAPRQWAADSIVQGKNLFQILEARGATRVRETQTYATVPRPYGFLYRQGFPDYPVQEAIVSHPDSAFSMRHNFLAKWSLGYFETPVVGPVKKWKSLTWQRAAFDDSSDQARLSLFAVRPEKADTLLASWNAPLDTTLDWVNFERLKLRYDAADTLARTATQPVFLRLLSEALPEGALNPAQNFVFKADTLQRGDSLHFSIAFKNVSDAAFDSVLVKYRIENQNGAGNETSYKAPPLNTNGDSFNTALHLGTLNLEGAQRLVLDVNPNNDQPELAHFNNVLVKDFYVTRDNRNPLLDVTFDGRHIMDGDLVSAKPDIIVTLKDDDRFLAISDTATFSLRLESPDGSVQNIPWNDPAVQFFPATTTDLPKKNQARLEWRPTFLNDGEYRLIVNGRDASGNESAALDWSVTFNIITKSALSSVLNYPNPFSTSTCFVYTLTGSEPPTHFKVRIMTVSGRVVREITEQEFGPLQIGTHRSDFCWDGRDEYGDQLANGVYLYQVVAKKADGSDFELHENQGIDTYFQHGFGKMVLMR
ncbi:MAG: hypothetical protein IT269_11465 [Saprospiraceae bacterium]|nr:hypothetical protein [Saprospiraceae bacterium]